MHRVGSIDQNIGWNDNDLLICGCCQYQFKDVKSFLYHKSNECMFLYEKEYNNSGKYTDESKTLLQYHEKDSYESYENMAGSTNYYSDLNNVTCVYNQDKTPKHNITNYDYNNRWNTGYISNNNISYIGELMLSNSKDEVFDTNQVSDLNYEMFPLNETLPVDSESYIEPYSDTINKSINNKVDINSTAISDPAIITINHDHMPTYSVDLDNTKDSYELYNCNCDIRNYNYYKKTNSQNIESLKDWSNNISNYDSTTSKPHVPVASKNDAVETKTLSQKGNILSKTSNNTRTIRKYTCTTCGKIFFRHSNLQQHTRLHTGEKPFQCPICGRKFVQKSNAKKHIQSHKIWGADEDSFSHSSILDVNLKNNKKIILRPSKSLSTIVERKQFHLLPNSNGSHFNYVHGVNNNPVLLVSNCFECKLCKQKFTSYLNLRKHSVIHKDQQIYLCLFADCKLTFKDLDVFLKHLEAHEKTESLSLTCQFCDVTLPNLYEFSCHLSGHKKTKENGEKISKDKNVQEIVTECPLCGEAFPSSLKLNKHIRSLHKNSVLFKCNECNKSFRTMASLKYHRVRHKMFALQPDNSGNTKRNFRKRFNRIEQKRSIQLSHNEIVDNVSKHSSDTESVLESSDKRNYENNDSMICFCCGKLYRRRQPFESHVLLCKQKELEKERRENYRKQKYTIRKEPVQQLEPSKSINCALDIDRSSRRSKFQKTWSCKPTRRKRTVISANQCVSGTEISHSEVKYTLPSISVLNKSYDNCLNPLNYNCNPYFSESLSFLKSLEFNP